MKKEDWILSSVYLLVLVIILTPLIVIISGFSSGFDSVGEYVLAVSMYLVLGLFVQLYPRMVRWFVNAEGVRRVLVLVGISLVLGTFLLTFGIFTTFLPMVFVMVCMDKKPFHDKILRWVGIKGIFLLYGYIAILVAFYGWIEW